MRTFLTFLVWLPYAASLGYLSYQGALACRLPWLIAAGLAGCLTCAGSVYAGRFRATRQWVDFAGMVLTLSLCTAFDFANLYDAIQRKAGVDVLTASAGADADAAEGARLRTEVSEAERAWIAARDLAEAERTQGKVSGHAGKGSTFDRLTAEAANLEQVLHRKEAALLAARDASKASLATVAAVDGGRHILATVPPWVLLVASAALELSLAGLGWGMGAPCERKRKAPACASTVAPVAVPAAPVATPGAGNSGQPEPCRVSHEGADAVEPGADEEGCGKVIPVSLAEIKTLARVARRAYRDPGLPTWRAAAA